MITKNPKQPKQPKKPKKNSKPLDLDGLEKVLDIPMFQLEQAPENQMRVVGLFGDVNEQTCAEVVQNLLVLSKMGEIDKKVWDYFREHKIDVGDYACDSDYGESLNVPEDCQPFWSGQWHDCDNIYHGWGASRNAGTLEIEDDKGEIVYSIKLDEVKGYDGPELTCGEEAWIEMKGKGSVVFYNYSSEKGIFFEGEILSSAAYILGGDIEATPIGTITPAAGKFTTLQTSGNVILGDASGDIIEIGGPNFIANAQINLIDGGSF